MTDGNQVCNDAAAGIAGAHSRAALTSRALKPCLKLGEKSFLQFTLYICTEFSTWAPYVRKRAKN